VKRDDAARHYATLLERMLDPSAAHGSLTNRFLARDRTDKHTVSAATRHSAPHAAGAVVDIAIGLFLIAMVPVRHWLARHNLKLSLWHLDAGVAGSDHQP
jgi:hypothetical protein